MKNITPRDLLPYSDKMAWWKCDKNPNHKYKSTINNRTKGNGCPYCSGKKVCKDNSLSTLKPELSKEWNYGKNGNLTPNDVTCYSKKKVWWICEKNHEWEAKISHRTNGSGCPYCSGKKVCKDNSLSTLKPDIAKEWSYKKNGNLTSNDVTSGSHKKVWWECEKGHEWEARISHRTNGKGCPHCYKERRKK
jgi:hypothetical protein